MNNKLIFVQPNPYFGKDFPKGPTPEDAKLREENKYLVLNIYEDREKDETMIVIVNGQGEIWSLSARHLRVLEVYQDNNLLFG